MTRKIIIAHPTFIKSVKAEIASKKERHVKLYSQISVKAAQKLQKMNGE